MGLEVHGVGKLSDALRRLSSVRFDAVCEKNIAQVYERGKSEGGTPVDTSDLKKSLAMVPAGEDSEAGYSMEYAPHVEYGHRTRGGGYVQGQRFLDANVRKQRRIFKKDLVAQIERFG